MNIKKKAADMTNPLVNCCQCNKPAIVNVNEKPLCVECFVKFTQASNQEIGVNISLLHQLDTYINQSRARMLESMFGLFPGTLTNPVTVSPTREGNHITYNNFVFDKSTIGAINLEKVHALDIAISQAQDQGASELIEPIKELTKSIVSSQEISETIKNELIEQLAFLTSQVMLPKEKRSSSIGRTIIQNIPQLLQGAIVLLNNWDKVKPLFEKIF